MQARLRDASAKTTLDVYGHLWPDKDEASRAAVAAAIAARAETRPTDHPGTRSVDAARRTSTESCGPSAD